MAKSWAAPVAAVLLLIYAGPALAGMEPMQSGQRLRDCPNCPQMVVVPAGNFLMGSSAADTQRDLKSAAAYDLPAFVRSYLEQEHPQHPVTIARPFGLGMYPVTKEEFAAFVQDTGYTTAGGCTLFDNHKYRKHADAGWQNPGFPQTDQDPVVCVSVGDAKAYIAWLNGKLRDPASTDGNGPYRLPSEAELEYSARAGTQTARWWGDEIGADYADCGRCGSRWDLTGTAPVGSFRSNPFGLYDMLGNVWEWAEDCWYDRYIDAPEDGSARVSGECAEHVMRSGSWNSVPWVLRTNGRSKQPTEAHENNLGFRIAKTLP